MTQGETEARVHRLLLQSLDDLDGQVGDEGWATQIEQLCGALLKLDPDIPATLAAVVRASSIIQQFLFALAVPESGEPTRDQVVEAITWMLDNLHNEDRGIHPAPHMVGVKSPPPAPTEPLGSQLASR